MQLFNILFIHELRFMNGVCHVWLVHHTIEKKKQKKVENPQKQKNWNHN